MEHDLTKNHKKIQMLSRGTKDLDQLLTIGQPPKANRSLGYNGKRSTSTVFVHATKPLEDQVITTEKCTCFGLENKKEKQVTVAEVRVKSTDNGKSMMCAEKKKEETVVSPSATKRRGCFACGRIEYKKAFCYRFLRKIYQAWKAEKCFIERRWFGKVWTAKEDLYPCQSGVNASEEIMCNHVVFDDYDDEMDNEEDMVLMVNEQNTVGVWYFDTGCS